MQEVVSVIGGGWSFAYVNHAKVPGKVICANEAGVLFKGEVAATVTMDRLWTENRWSRLCALKQLFYVRKGCLANIPKDERGQRWVRPFDNTNKPIQDVGPYAFGEFGHTLNGDNSGVCALNLAYIERPTQLLMFGFDMCRHPNGNPYWYPPYSWVAKTGGTKPRKYETWAHEFNSIALAFARIGTEVLNVSEHSKIVSFRRVSPKQLGMEA